MIILLVKYQCKSQMREEFLRAIQENQIDTKSREEAGNLRYEYSYSITNADELVLTEVWKDEESVKIHGASEHFKQLGELKPIYVEETQIEKYQASRV